MDFCGLWTDMPSPVNENSFFKKKRYLIPDCLVTIRETMAWIEIEGTWTDNNELHGKATISCGQLQTSSRMLSLSLTGTFDHNVLVSGNLNYCGRKFQFDSIESSNVVAQVVDKKNKQESRPKGSRYFNYGRCFLFDGELKMHNQTCVGKFKKFVENTIEKYPENTAESAKSSIFSQTLRSICPLALYFAELLCFADSRLMIYCGCIKYSSLATKKEIEIHIDHKMTFKSEPICKDVVQHLPQIQSLSCFATSSGELAGPRTLIHRLFQTKCHLKLEFGVDVSNDKSLSMLETSFPCFPSNAEDLMKVISKEANRIHGIEKCDDVVDVLIKYQGCGYFCMSSIYTLELKLKGNGTLMYQATVLSEEMVPNVVEGVIVSGNFNADSLCFTTFVEKFDIKWNTIDVCGEHVSCAYNSIVRSNSNVLDINAQIKQLQSLGCHITFDPLKCFLALCAKIKSLRMQYLNQVEKQGKWQSNAVTMNQDEFSFNVIMQFLLETKVSKLEKSYFDKILFGNKKEYNRSAVEKLYQTECLPWIEHVMRLQMDRMEKRRRNLSWDWISNVGLGRWNVLHYGVYLNNAAYIELGLKYRKRTITMVKNLNREFRKFSFVTQPDNFGNTPIHLAAIYNRAEMVLLLFDEMKSNGFKSLKKANDEHWIPLACAVINNSTECLKVLLEQTFKVVVCNTKSFQGFTVFTLAVAHKRWKMLDILLEYCKVNMESKDEYGVSVKDYLIEQHQLLSSENKKEKKELLDCAPKFCQLLGWGDIPAQPSE